MVNSPQGSWIAAGAALEHLVATTDNRTEAKTKIAELLKDCLVSSHAEMIWESDNSNVNNALARTPQVEPEDVLPVPSHLWRSSINWAQDLAQWRWDQGIFCITRSVEPVERVFVHGVHLSLDELKLHFPEQFRPRRGVGGRPRQQDSRDAFWFAVVELAVAQRLTTNSFLTQAELQNEIEHLVKSRHGALYGQRTMAGLVRQVWRKFVEPS